MGGCPGPRTGRSPGRKAATRRRPASLGRAAVLAIGLLASGGQARAIVPARADSLRFGPFGDVAVYRPVAKPTSVVLFISGDGGWNLGVVDMARDLVGLDALVVGVDIRAYRRGLAESGSPEGYPAGDFEALSHFVQRRLDLPTYLSPILVGYSSGATLAYATLVQAPSGTFAGAISLGFCPDLNLPKPLARGNGLRGEATGDLRGFLFQPAADLVSPWIVLQGDDDQVCSPAIAADFTARTARGRTVPLPGVGHGFGVTGRWLPQLRDALASIRSESPTAGGEGDLPLVEVPAPGGGPVFAVLWSGDGGWAGLDREVAAALAQAGMPVVGVNSLRYFWRKRTPEEAADALARVVRRYALGWRKERVLLAGYSLGADVLPFLVTRLPEDVRSRLAGVALIGPSRTADFEFHLTDWVGRGSGQPTLPEVRRLRGLPLSCVYGEQEEDSLCRELNPGDARILSLPGGHHLGGRTEAIARFLLEGAGAP